MALTVEEVEAVFKLRDEMSPQLKNMQASLQSVGAAAQSAGKTLTLSVTAPLTALATAAFVAGKTVDEAMDDMRISTGKTGKELDALGASFKVVFADVPASASTVAGAMAQVAIKTGLVGKPLEEMTTQLVKLGSLTKSEVVPLVQTTTEMFGAWGVKTQDQSKALDFLFNVTQKTGSSIGSLSGTMKAFGPIMQGLGFTFEESAALLGQWEKSGLSAGTMITGLRTAMAQFAEAGIPMQQGLEATIAKIKELGPSTEASGVAMQVFGSRAGTVMAKAIHEGKLSVDELLKSIAGSGDTIAKASADTFSFGEQWIVFRNKMTLALEPLGTRLLQVLTDLQPLVLGVVRKITELGEWFAALSPKTQEWVIWLGAAIAALGPISYALNTFSGLLQSSLTMLAPFIELLVKLAIQAGVTGTAVTGMSLALTGLVGAIGLLAVGGILMFIDKVKGAENAVKDFQEIRDKKPGDLISGQELITLDNYKNKLDEINKARGKAIDSGNILNVTTDQHGKALASVGPKINAHALNLDRLTKGGTDAADAQAAYNKELADLSGKTAVDAATSLLEKLTKIPPIQNLTAETQQAINATMAKAVAVYTAWGQVAPKAVTDTLRATQALLPVTTSWVQGLLMAGPAIDSNAISLRDFGLEATTGVTALQELAKRQKEANLELGQMGALAPQITGNMAEMRTEINDTDSATLTWTQHLSELAQSFAQLGQAAGGALGEAAQWFGALVNAVSIADKAGVSAEKNFTDFRTAIGSGETGKAAAAFGMLAVNVLSTAAAFMQATATGSTLMKTLSGAAVGAQFGSAFSPVGTIVGGIIGGAAGFFRGIFGGGNEVENAGRKVADQFRNGIIAGLNSTQMKEAAQQALGAWKGNEDGAKFAIGLRDEYRKLGLSAQEALADAEKLWRAQKQGAQAAAIAVAEIKEKMEAVKEAQTFLDTTLPSALDKVASSGALVTKEFQAMLTELQRMGVATETINAFIIGQAKAAASGITQFLQVGANAYTTLGAKQKALAAATAEYNDLLRRGFGKNSNEVNAVRAQIEGLNAEILKQIGIVNASGIKTAAQAATFGATIAGVFAQLKASGMTTTAALAAVAPAVAALQAQLAATGLTGGAAFEAIAALAKLASDEIAGPALQGVEGLAAALVGLHNSGILTQDMFAGLTNQITNTFDSLIAQGFDADQVLQLMAPSLQTVWELMTDFGYEVDAATAALINQAKAAGLVGDSHRDAGKAATKAMQDAADAMKAVATVLEGIFGKNGDAASGIGGFADTAEKAVADSFGPGGTIRKDIDAAGQQAVTSFDDAALAVKTFATDAATDISAVFGPTGSMKTDFDSTALSMQGVFAAVLGEVDLFGINTNLKFAETFGPKGTSLLVMDGFVIAVEGKFTNILTNMGFWVEDVEILMNSAFGVDSDIQGIFIDFQAFTGGVFEGIRLEIDRQVGLILTGLQSVFGTSGTAVAAFTDFGNAVAGALGPAKTAVDQFVSGVNAALASIPRTITIAVVTSYQGGGVPGDQTGSQTSYQGGGVPGDQTGSQLLGLSAISPTHFAEGGFVRRTGLAIVHTGETVTPADREPLPAAGEEPIEGHSGIIKELQRLNAQMQQLPTLLARSVRDQIQVRPAR